MLEIKYSKSYLTYQLHRACSIYINVNLVEAKTANTNLTWLYFYLHISIQIFCTLLICFALDGLLQSNCFRMFYSKHSITFDNTYLLSFWFHSVDIPYIEFRFCETFTVMNSVIRILLIGILNADLPYTCTSMF